MSKVKRAYRYRFYPTPEQAHNLACTFGCCRFIYNWALHRRKRAYFDHGVKLYTKDLSAAIPALKKAEGTSWLKEVSSVPLQQALRHPCEGGNPVGLQATGGCQSPCTTWSSV